MNRPVKPTEEEKGRVAKHHRRAALLGMLAILVLASPSVHATILDLTTAGASGTINGAYFQQFDPDTSTGSGVINPFVQIRATGIEEGYNTDGRPLEFDESNAWTKSLLLVDVPLVTVDETLFREFLLDINQDASILSLDMLQISLQSDPNLLGYSSIFSSPIYDLDVGGDGDSWVKLNYSLNAGSGGGDMLVLIPDSLFAGTGEYVYLYSMFGASDSSSFPADDGFEEWSVGANGPIIPEPATILLLGLGGLLSLRRRDS